MTIKQQLITATNSVQNLGQPEYNRANMMGNLSVENPTVEQLNAGIFGSQMPSKQAVIDEPAFGEHIKEAAETIRRIFR